MVEANISDLIDESVKEALRRKDGRSFYGKISEPESAVRMGLNENLLIDASFAGALLQEAARRTDARVYPAEKGRLAVRALAEGLGLWEDEVIAGNGSDEILDLIAKVFVGRGEALIVDPTFEMYGFYVRLVGGRVRTALMNGDFTLDPDAVLSSLTPSTRAVFICSPNNPTGLQFDREAILRVVAESGRLVVVDEAYADFAPYSLLREAPKYPNLLVLRTFSKAFGLAGLRIGYGLANAEIIGWLRSAQSPFSINSVAQQAARLTLENKNVYDSFVKNVIEERSYLMAELQMINGVTPFQSDANFILFRVDAGESASAGVWQRLKAAGIEVRDRGSLPLLRNCLRVTVSTRENNMKFIKVLGEAVRGLD